MKARGVQPALRGGRRRSAVFGIGAVLVTATPAFAQTAEPTVADLQKVIERLVRRVETLERQVRTGTPATGNQPVTRAVARSRAGAPPPEPTEVALHPGEGPPPPITAQAAPPPPPAPQAPASAAPSAPAPGQFEVSEEAAERALERTLAATSGESAAN